MKYVTLILLVTISLLTVIIAAPLHAQTNTNCIIIAATCPSDAIEQARLNEFFAHHKEIVPGEPNATIIRDYIAEYNLDPHDRKTYKLIYRDLRYSGKLTLYKK